MPKQEMQKQRVHMRLKRMLMPKETLKMFHIELEKVP